ncbi:MAG: DUF4885 domain-containing protein [Methanocorpusculum sp.]|nr:DUF4885 domain-containing protein [Methanocorpusculum sp.]
MIRNSYISGVLNYNQLLFMIMNHKLQTHNDDLGVATKAESKSNKNLDGKSKSVASDGFISQSLYDTFLIRYGYVRGDYHVSDGSPVKMYDNYLKMYVSNAYQQKSKSHEIYCRKQDNEINRLLKQNGIELGANEKLTFTVEMDYKVKVSGTVSDEECKRIEKILNGSNSLLANKSVGYQLFYRSCIMVDGFHGKMDNQRFIKWELSNYLQESADVSINDLKMVNGEIEGGNDKLNKMLHGDEEDMDEFTLHTYKGMMTKLKSLLTIGLHNIQNMQC